MTTSSFDKGPNIEVVSVVELEQSIWNEYNFLFQDFGIKALQNELLIAPSLIWLEWHKNEGWIEGVFWEPNIEGLDSGCGS